MIEDMVSPLKLTSRVPEAMKFTGSYDNTLAFIEWLESHGASAEWHKPGILTEDPHGKKFDEPQWFAERIYVTGKRNFKRFIFIDTWVIVDVDDTLRAMTDAVMKKIWKEAR